METEVEAFRDTVVSTILSFKKFTEDASEILRKLGVFLISPHIDSSLYRLLCRLGEAIRRECAMELAGFEMTITSMNRCLPA